MLIAIATRRGNVALYGTATVTFRQQVLCCALEPQIESMTIDTRQREPHFMVAVATASILSEKSLVAELHQLVCHNRTPFFMEPRITH
jgi:hypothetical protein